MCVSRRAFLLCAAPVFGQFTSSVRVVNVFVTVRDNKGQLVRGLQRADFQVFEDGHAQEIRYFSADSDLPLTIGLLFDISGSQRSVIVKQREAAQEFLRKILREGDSSFLIAFDRRVMMLKDLSTLDAQSEDSRGTALFDALVQAANGLKNEPGRKTLVVLSDGIDTASNARVADAITAAARTSTLVYPIRFYDQEVFRFQVQSPALDNLIAGKKTLEKIAKETGGAMYEVSGARSLENNFERIQDELRTQYSLGYSPMAGKAGYRKLRVTVRQRGLTVQARDGYFASE
jgi:VWFA-related protein